MHVFISMHLGYSLRNPSLLCTENLIQVSELLLGKGKQYMKYILAFMCYQFRDRSSSFLLFKMLLFTHILLLSLLWIVFTCDIAIDLFWSEIIVFISVEQTSGLSEWIIINFFFFFFKEARNYWCSQQTALWGVHYTLSLQGHQKSFWFCVMPPMIMQCVSAVYNDPVNRIQLNSFI